MLQGTGQGVKKRADSSNDAGMDETNRAGITLCARACVK